MESIYYFPNKNEQFNFSSNLSKNNKCCTMTSKKLHKIRFVMKFKLILVKKIYRVQPPTPFHGPDFLNSFKICEYSL